MSLAVVNATRLVAFLGKPRKCATKRCTRSAVPGLARCSDCLEADVRRHLTSKRKKVVKATYALKKATGICVYPCCTKFAAQDRVRCGLHLEEDVERKSKRRAEWVKEGRCCQCGDERDPSSKSRCPKHLQDARDKAREKRGYHDRRVCACGRRILRGEAEACWACAKPKIIVREPKLPLGVVA